MKTQSSKKIIGAFDDLIEAKRNITQGISDSLTNDLAKGSINDLLRQIGAEDLVHAQTKGEMHEGEEIDLKKKEKKEQPKHVEPAYNYAERIIHGEGRIHAEDSREIAVKIEEIMIELKKIVEGSKELQVEFMQVTIEQAPKKPGKYHLNFVEWLLQNVMQIRLRIEDSSAWLAMFKSKKDKRKYWNMFKKHGTTFGLSNERNVSTQVG
jgi:hypothetical protein